MPVLEGTYRLLTRSDFDGIVCAALLKERGLVSELEFVHPRDMQDGLISVGPRDITANLPYVPGVAISFDHHASEFLRSQRAGQQHADQRESAAPDGTASGRNDHVIDPDAPSAARVIYEYFGGTRGFPGISADLMDAVDRGDSADYGMEEVLSPGGWTLLNFITDSRTGLGRYRDFTLSNAELMYALVDWIRECEIEEILAIPDVAARVDLYRQHEPLCREQILRVGRLHSGVLTLDMRGEELIYAGNRFVKYALFPQARVSIDIIWGRRKQNTVIAVGKSIFHQMPGLSIGELLMACGGGGHDGAGTCQVPNDQADETARRLLERLSA